MENLDMQSEEANDEPRIAFPEKETKARNRDQSVAAEGLGSTSKDGNRRQMGGVVSLYQMVPKYCLGLGMA